MTATFGASFSFMARLSLTVGRVGRRLITIGCVVSLGSGVFGCGDNARPRDATSTKQPAKAAKPSPPRPPGAEEEPGQTRTNALGKRELPGIRLMLSRLVTGVNRRDPSVCTRVYTQSYREQLFARQGAAAVAACRKEISGTDFQASLVRIERAVIHRSPSGELSGPVRVLQRIDENGLVLSDLVVVKTAYGYRILSGRGKQIS
jgi:hypothetical protein